MADKGKCPCGGPCAAEAAFDVVLLPKPRPAPRERGTLGAQYAAEVVCPACGPTWRVWAGDRYACGRCRQPLEDKP